MFFSLGPFYNIVFYVMLSIPNLFENASKERQLDFVQVLHTIDCLSCVCMSCLKTKKKSINQIQIKLVLSMFYFI